MLANAKVSELEINKVYSEITKFLAEKYDDNSKSENTIREYERDIRTFFTVLRGKDIEYLTVEDIHITKEELRDYKNYLYRELKNGDSTVNRKLSTIKSLYAYFDEYELIKTNNTKNIKSKTINNKNHHGHLSIEEVWKMAELIKVQPRVKKREVKYYLILFAVDTCLRKNAILNLKWSDFEAKDDNCVVVRAIDKGNKEFRPLISKDFYNQLLSIKEDNSEYVFNITTNGIQNMMDKLNEWMGFPSERNIVFHSFRKAGVTFQYRVTGDILQAKKAANHSSITTTELYVEEEKYGLLGAVSSTGSIDEDLYKKVELCDLISAIDKLPKSQRMLLNIKLNELTKMTKINS